MMEINSDPKPEACVSWLPSKVPKTRPPGKAELELLRALLNKGQGGIAQLERFIGLCKIHDQYQIAIEQCLKVSETNPFYPEVMKWVADLYFDLNDSDTGIHYYKKWHESSGRTAESAAALARALADKPAEAIPYLEVSLGNPERGQDEARALLSALAKLGRFDEAKSIFYSSEERFPFDSSLKYRYLKWAFDQDSTRLNTWLRSSQTLVHTLHLPQEFPKTDFNKLNDSLASYITSQRELLFEPGSYTTRLGSQVSIHDFSEESVKRLTDCIKSEIERYIRHQSSFSSPDLYNRFPRDLDFKCWAVVLGRGGHQLAHIHKEAIVSGVYYIQVPQSVAASKHPSSGWLEIGNEQWTLPDAKEAGSFLQHVKPENGLLVVFPSFIPHRTIPLESDESRICIAFDAFQPRKEATKPRVNNPSSTLAPPIG